MNLDINQIAVLVGGVLLGIGLTQERPIQILSGIILGAIVFGSLLGKVL